jgi:hypothetical protein
MSSRPKVFSNISQISRIMGESTNRHGSTRMTQALLEFVVLPRSRVIFFCDFNQPHAKMQGHALPFPGFHDVTPRQGYILGDVNKYWYL